MNNWYWPDFKGHYWVSLVVYGWDGGLHVMDDFGNLIPVV